ncbi:MAG: hypothetical protein C0406_10110 [Sideroxydans sp.]|nr:hypothetical protein [Sideroxydans sp.]
MADFPYTQVTGKLKSFLEKIQQVGRPDIVDKKWLASLGFHASNDATIIPILKFIGFVDQSGKPIDNRWLTYRGDKSRARKVLAEGIYKGYTELFQTYPDAHQRSYSDLESFFSTRSTAGAQVISQTVKTFMTLCELADFSDVAAFVQLPTPEPLSPSGVVDAAPGITRTAVRGLGTGVTININIQLTLPETTDENVYNKFFEALKTHLLPEQL